MLSSLCIHSTILVDWEKILSQARQRRNSDEDKIFFDNLHASEFFVINAYSSESGQKQISAMKSRT